MNIKDLKINEPFLLVKNENSSDIIFCSFGKINKFDNLNNVKIFYKKIENILILMPFSSIKEKYSDINIKRDNKILSGKIDSQTILQLGGLDNYLKYECIINESKFEISDEDFKSNVQNVIDNEINNGSGSNFLIAQKLTGSFESFDKNKALGLFARLCKNEYGAYQVFCLFTGEFYLIGASPECHLNVQDKIVRMQPISGTYRKTDETTKVQKDKILNFLSDKKEINELFMTVDEELKMMAKICSSCGMIIGPRLREMSKVIHTEYLLTGETEMDVFDAIKESMFAATVIGSPLKKAAEISEVYNNIDRKYYGGLIGIFQDENHFDSSIVIRSIMIENNGDFEICTGASVVQDSVPENELLEVKAKLSGMLSNFQNTNLIKNLNKIMPYLQFDHNICETLCKRNQNLSNFLFFDKNGKYTIDDQCTEMKVVIIDNEDDFVNSLSHMLTKMGMISKIIK